MKDFKFLMGIAKTAEEIPVVMQSLLAPFEGQIHAFHHDISLRGQHFVVTYTLQLLPHVHNQRDNPNPKGYSSNKGRDVKGRSN